MTRRLIDFTEDSSLRQTISPALSFSYIRALVDQHLGADAAAMLSEPQVVPREGRHQWLADAAIDSSLVRLDQASPDQAAAARRRLDEARLLARAIWENLNSGNEQNRQQAVAILRAFEVPNDDEYVWLVGEQPLLVGWGHERVNVVPLEPAALALTYSRPLAEADPATALTEFRTGLTHIAMGASSGSATRDAIVEMARNMSVGVVRRSRASGRRAASAGLLDPSPGNGMALELASRLRGACAKSACGISRAKSRPRTGFACPANRVAVTRLLSGPSFAVSFAGTRCP